MLVLGIVLLLLFNSTAVEPTAVSDAVPVSFFASAFTETTKNLFQQDVIHLCKLDLSDRIIADDKCDEVGRGVAEIAVKVVGEIGHGVGEEWDDDEILDIMGSMLVDDTDNTRSLNGTRQKRRVLSKVPKFAKKSWPVVKKFLKDVWGFLKNYLMMEGASGIQERVEGEFGLTDLCNSLYCYLIRSVPCQAIHPISPPRRCRPVSCQGPSSTSFAEEGEEEGIQVRREVCHLLRSGGARPEADHQHLHFANYHYNHYSCATVGPERPLQEGPGPDREWRRSWEAIGGQLGRAPYLRPRRRSHYVPS
jgi:hypothetical protein